MHLVTTTLKHDTNSFLLPRPALARFRPNCGDGAAVAHRDAGAGLSGLTVLGGKLGMRRVKGGVYIPSNDPVDDDAFGRMAHEIYASSPPGCDGSLLELRGGIATCPDDGVERELLQRVRRTGSAHWRMSGVHESVIREMVENAAPSAGNQGLLVYRHLRSRPQRCGVALWPNGQRLPARGRRFSRATSTRCRESGAKFTFVRMYWCHYGDHIREKRTNWS